MGCSCCESYEAHVRAVVDRMPPLTDEQRQTLRALFLTSPLLRSSGNPPRPAARKRV